MWKEVSIVNPSSRYRQEVPEPRLCTFRSGVWSMGNFPRVVEPIFAETRIFSPSGLLTGTESILDSPTEAGILLAGTAPD